MGTLGAGRRPDVAFLSPYAPDLNPVNTCGPGSSGTR